MLRKEDFAVIRALKKHDVYLKDIAAELGVHPKTVSRALQRGSAPRAVGRRRPSKLDPYKATVDRLVGEGVWNVMVLLREIQAEGYTSGSTMLRLYVQPKRALRPGRATVRFETEPGKQLQSDWGEIVAPMGGKPTKVHFQVNELGYSRRFHVWCTDREDAEHTYEGLVRSLEYFGGVPEEVLVDNQKSAVLLASNSGHPRFNERFIDLAGHYGFTPRACRPYRARTKGKDERTPALRRPQCGASVVGYVKHNFFVRYRAFESWAHLNQLLERWLAEEADQRVQGTVKEVVAERFLREAPCLKPLPLHRYDTSYLELRRVGWDGYVNVRGNRYSVPGELVGQTVVVRLGLDDRLRIFHADQLVASHSLRPAEAGWNTVPEHHAALWQATVNVEQRSLEAYEEVASWS